MSIPQTSPCGEKCHVSIDDVQHDPPNDNNSNMLTKGSIVSDDIPIQCW